MDGYEREWVPLPAASTPDRRGIVNEAAFLLFKAVSDMPRAEVGEAIKDRLNSSFAAAVAYVLSVADSGEEEPSPAEAREVVALALRLYTFFAPLRDKSGLIVSPPFKGSGIISTCRGDVLVGNSRLFEIKNGDRAFRSIDYRQLITYVALHFGASGQVLDEMVLLNARRGICVAVGTEYFARSVSGQSAASLCHLVIEAMSASLVSE